MHVFDVVYVLFGTCIALAAADFFVSFLSRRLGHNVVQIWVHAVNVFVSRAVRSFIAIWQEIKNVGSSK